MKSLQHTMLIRTPERIVFPLILASPLTRMLALLIDIVIIQVCLSVMQMVMSLLGILSIDIAYALYMVASFLMSILYPILMEWYWRGQTVGKKIMKLQVMDVQGFKLQFSQIVVRNLLRGIDMLPLFYMVGGLSSFLSSKRQRLGDIAGNTIVILHEKVQEPDFEQLLPDKYNSFRQYQQFCSQLRHNTSPKEAGLLLQAILRRDEFDPEERINLFSSLRSHFEAKAKFPEDATEGISDERYIRNLLDILYKPTEY